MNNKIKIYSVLILIIFLYCCSADDKGGEMSVNSDTNNKFVISKGFIEKISKKKIYFGHMSVGNNIMHGINDLLLENNLKLKIIETNNVKDFESSIFAHSRIGKNTYPKSKVDAFIETMNNGLGNKVDIAFFKFCYVDIVSDTNIESIFDYYIEKMDNLIKTYPHTKYIHFTVPLSTYKEMSLLDKFKDLIKSITGKSTLKERHIKNNITRKKYNEKLRRKYKKDEIFDLAFFESNYQNGNREIIKYKETQFESLVPYYTSDGGHLNKEGRKKIANHLLNFIDELN